MQTIETSRITPDQLAALDAYAATADSEIRAALHQIIACVRGGAKLAVIGCDESVPPSEAAQRLGMSRTHLYKLLDRGEIPFFRVGRDRRIRLQDLLDFDARRRRDRHELAERFAGQSQTHAGAVDEIADVL